ncbi:FeoB-associated Cys-rich membrane protein [Lentisphaerota bacterium]|nr:FeoB-associated Cys-rich membrane protein [Lentisphaerota bacterium]
MIVGIIVLVAILVIIRNLRKIGKEGGGCSCCDSACSTAKRNKCHGTAENSEKD